MSSCDCPYLIAPAFACAVFHSRSSVNDLSGAAEPSDFSQALKSRFIPYLRTTEQSSSLPLAFVTPEHWPQRRKLFLGSGSTTLGMFAGSTMIAPCALRTAIASSIAFFCSGFRPPPLPPPPPRPPRPPRPASAVVPAVVPAGAGSPPGG